MIRKLLATIALLTWTTMSVKAQTFEFQYHGEGVADGGTVTIPAVEDEFGFGELWCESNPSSNPNYGLILKLNEGTEADGSATINIERNTLDPSIVKWCMGGECMLFNNKTSLTKSFSVTEGSVQIQFDAENIKSEGDLLATLTVTIGEEIRSVKILFTNGASTDIKSSVYSGNGLGQYYMLNGRKVERPLKGIYIRDGKKYQMPYKSR